MNLKVLAMVLVLGSITQVAWTQGQGSVCANVKATQVDAEFETSGVPKTCGLGIVIFGVGGSIVGEKCYPLETTVPAHQTCQGEANFGTYCAPDGRIQVDSRECRCGGLVLPFLNTGIPAKCICKDADTQGTVEDFETKECVGV